MAATELTYIQRTDASVRDLLLEFECQPILFIGSGLPQRYIGAPTWRELLSAIFLKLPEGSETYEYNRQKFDDDPIMIGTRLADLVFEWAWSEGKDQFPPEMYKSNIKKNAFLKLMACRHIQSFDPKNTGSDEFLKREIAALAAIKPHAIITTNDARGL